MYLGETDEKYKLKLSSNGSSGEIMNLLATVPRQVRARPVRQINVFIMRGQRNRPKLLKDNLKVTLIFLCFFAASFWK